MSPLDRSSASRIFCSMSGPRITPRINGSTGIPNLRIAKPIPPKSSSSSEVERILVDAVGAQRCEEQDPGVELRPRDLQQPRPQRCERQVDHQQEGVSDEQAGEQRPHELGLVGHQGRAGLDAVGAHRRDDHRRRCRHRQAEGEQRHEHAGRAGVVGGLRSGHALDGALAERLPVRPRLLQATLEDVGQEGRRLRAAGRDRAEGEADRGAPHPRSPRTTPVTASHERLPDRDHLDGPAPQVRGDPERLADREDADRHDDDVDPVGELEQAEREPWLAGREVEAHQADRQTHEQPDEATQLGLAEHGRDQHDREQHDREVRRGADLDRLLGQRRA